MKNLHIITVKKRYALGALLLTSLFAVVLVFIYKINLEYNTEDYTSLPIYYGDAEYMDVQEGSSEARLAIIIDDFGQSRDGVKEMMEIGRHLTFAVMPFLEFSQTDAEEGYRRGYEIIAHLPMEPVKGKLSWLGPRPILSGMDSDTVKKIVMDAFESVPHAVGANIHMGSKASSEESIVSSILNIIKEKQLYFVDSRTSYHPVAKKIADLNQILCFERNIFIDGTKSKDYIKKQLQKAEDFALKHGNAIAIGHVGQEGGKATAQAIKEMLPEFDEKGIKLVYISELIN